MLIINCYSSLVFGYYLKDTITSLIQKYFTNFINVVTKVFNCYPAVFEAD
jgi:hypothetical protein